LFRFSTPTQCVNPANQDNARAVSEMEIVLLVLLTAGVGTNLFLAAGAEMMFVPVTALRAATLLAVALLLSTAAKPVLSVASRKVFMAAAALVAPICEVWIWNFTLALPARRRPTDTITTSAFVHCWSLLGPQIRSPEANCSLKVSRIFSPSGVCALKTEAVMPTSSTSASTT